MNEDHRKHFSPFVAGAFTLNYIIGSGFLLLPWAFFKAGLALSTFTLGVICVLSIAAVCFIMDSTYLAIRITNSIRLNSNKSSDSTISPRSGKYSPRFITLSSQYGSVLGLPSEGAKDDRLKVGPGESSRKSGSYDETIALLPTDSTVVRPRQWEIPDLCYFYLGSYGKVAYGIVLCMYMYGTLWAYASVFAKALPAASFLPPLPYTSYLMIFSLFVVPLSLMELSEQKIVQVGLAICRFVMLFLMISTIVYSVLYNIQSFSDVLPVDTETVDFFSTIPLANFHNLYLLLPVATYANIFHHSVPALAEPLANMDDVIPVLSTTLIVCFVFYVLIGAVVSCYFVEHVRTASNLNWSTYVGYLGPSNSFQMPEWARFVSSFVLLFPAFDVASAFPLNAITLGNGLMSFYYTDSTQVDSRWFPVVKTSFRLLAAIPPIIGAACVTDLGVITDYTGVTGFAIAFIFPSLLMVAAEQRCRTQGVSSRTPYSHILTGSVMQYATLAFGVFMTVYVTVHLYLQR